jgi:hypothetical protein
MSHSELFLGTISALLAVDFGGLNGLEILLDSDIGGWTWWVE